MCLSTVGHVYWLASHAIVSHFAIHVFSVRTGSFFWGGGEIQGLLDLWFARIDHVGDASSIDITHIVHNIVELGGRKYATHSRNEGRGDRGVDLELVVEWQRFVREAANLFFFKNSACAAAKALVW